PATSLTGIPALSVLRCTDAPVSTDRFRRGTPTTAKSPTADRSDQCNHAVQQAIALRYTDRG
ncbi:hypothetical protein, partial [Varibaculum cambriense]|uniref:hypothetical protein n=1 Tax=Varibaculum cambriense TaxID=184870 RepID=UPI0029001472